MTGQRLPLPPLSPIETELQTELSAAVEALSLEIGERNILRRPEALHMATLYIEASLTQIGCAVRRQPVSAEGRTCFNLHAEVQGTDHVAGAIVVGAHYDTVPGSPGANDNATGVAALLSLARRFAQSRPAHTIIFAAFVNEEPPFFQTPQMGSRIFARSLKEGRIPVRSMVCLETLGCYRDTPGSQNYPPPLAWFYPNRGDFLAFVGNLHSRALTRRMVECFRKRASLPCEWGALPSILPGVGWSDHWSFWKEGFEAVMVTDTALYRYPEYHTPMDTPDRIDYGRLARAAAGLEAVLSELAECSDPP